MRGEGSSRTSGSARSTRSTCITMRLLKSPEENELVPRARLMPLKSGCHGVREGEATADVETHKPNARAIPMLFVFMSIQRPL